MEGHQGKTTKGKETAPSPTKVQDSRGCSRQIGAQPSTRCHSNTIYKSRSSCPMDNMEVAENASAAHAIRYTQQSEQRILKYHNYDELKKKLSQQLNEKAKKVKYVARHCRIS